MRRAEVCIRFSQSNNAAHADSRVLNPSGDCSRTKPSHYPFDKMKTMTSSLIKVMKEHIDIKENNVTA